MFEKLFQKPKQEVTEADYGFTPGEWINNNGWIYSSCSGAPIVTCSTNLEFREHYRANARLVAQSKQMFDLVREVLNTSEDEELRNKAREIFLKVITEI